MQWWAVVNHLVGANAVRLNSEHMDMHAQLSSYICHHSLPANTLNQGEKIQWKGILYAFPAAMSASQPCSASRWALYSRQPFGEVVLPGTLMVPPSALPFSYACETTLKVLRLQSMRLQMEQIVPQFCKFVRHNLSAIIGARSRRCKFTMVSTEWLHLLLHNPLSAMLTSAGGALRLSL